MFPSRAFFISGQQFVSYHLLVLYREINISARIEYRKTIINTIVYLCAVTTIFQATLGETCTEA